MLVLLEKAGGHVQMYSIHTNDGIFMEFTPAVELWLYFPLNALVLLMKVTDFIQFFNINTDYRIECIFTPEGK